MPEHEIQKMLPRHQVIVDLALEGRSNVAIAEEVGMTPQAIGMITRAPIFQDALARRREEMRKKTDESRTIEIVDARQKLQQASVRAADTLIGQLEHESAPVAQGAAKEILSRVFGKDDQGQSAIMIDKASIQLLAITLQESEQFRKPNRKPND